MSEKYAVLSTYQFARLPRKNFENSRMGGRKSNLMDSAAKNGMEFGWRIEDL